MVFSSFRTIPEIQLKKGTERYTAPSLSQPEIDKQLAGANHPQPIAHLLLIKAFEGIGCASQFSWEPI